MLCVFKEGNTIILVLFGRGVLLAEQVDSEKLLLLYAVFVHHDVNILLCSVWTAYRVPPLAVVLLIGCSLVAKHLVIILRGIVLMLGRIVLIGVVLCSPSPSVVLGHWRYPTLIIKYLGCCLRWRYFKVYLLLGTSL